MPHWRRRSEVSRQVFSYLWLPQNVARLKNSEEIIHNPKTILRVMKKYGLLSEIRRRRRWQQMGQQLHKYQNLLNRNFQAEAPNRKW